MRFEVKKIEKTSDKAFLLIQVWDKSLFVPMLLMIIFSLQGGTWRHRVKDRIQRDR
jgi:hypothetical protein